MMRESGDGCEQLLAEDRRLPAAHIADSDVIRAPVTC